MWAREFRRGSVLQRLRCVARVGCPVGAAQAGERPVLRYVGVDGDGRTRRCRVGSQSHVQVLPRDALGDRAARWYGREVHRRCRDGGVRRSDRSRGRRAAGCAGRERDAGSAGEPERRARAAVRHSDRAADRSRDRRSGRRRLDRAPGDRDGRHRERRRSAGASGGAWRDSPRRADVPTRPRRSHRGADRAAVAQGQGRDSGRIPAAHRRRHAARLRVEVRGGPRRPGG